MMNKFGDNPWALKLLSLIFAVFLYSFVQSENYSYQAAFNSQLATSVNSTETFFNVPLYLGDHPDNIFVSDIQETVTVRLDGARNILNQVTPESFMVQTEPITEENLGSTRLSLEIEGLPEEISYRITPATVLVEVEQRETLTREVEYTIDESLLSDDYEVTGVNLNPAQVQLVGTEDDIQSIDFVGVNITSQLPINDTFTANYRLQILDAQGKPLDINADTMEIEATVAIQQNSIEVPLRITAVGEDNQNINYAYEFVNSDTVILYGSQELLDKIDYVEVVVDVSEFRQSQTTTGMLNLPAGITSASASEVEVAVTIEIVE